MMMLERLKKWWRSEEDLADDHDGGPLPTENGDWVVMPYRLAESCRISLHTISSHPDLPPLIRWWITTWLAQYNAHLVGYFTENYGREIFPVLDEITARVMKVSEDHYSQQSDVAVKETFDKWEAELGGEDG